MSNLKLFFKKRKPEKIFTYRTKMANLNTELKTSNYILSYPPKTYSLLKENTTKTKHHKDHQSKGKQRLVTILIYL